MDNDLISREALERVACVKFYTTPYYKHILDLIDNAPTVEEKPQGEWQPISEGNKLIYEGNRFIGRGNRHECNQCKEYAPSFKDGSEHLSKFARIAVQKWLIHKAVNVWNLTHNYILTIFNN